MKSHDPEIRRASDEAENWLNLFPLVCSEERAAFMEWMRASPVHMRASAERSAPSVESQCSVFSVVVQTLTRADSLHLMKR